MSASPDRHELTAEFVLVRSAPYFLKSCQKARVSRARRTCPAKRWRLSTHDMLSVRTLVGLQGERNPGVFLCLRSEASAFINSSKHSLIILINRKQDNVCEIETRVGQAV